MYYSIADLIVDIPDIGDMQSRASSYICNEKTADIFLRPCKERVDSWPLEDEFLRYYMESGECFYRELLNNNGLMLHASGVIYKGKAYLFSGQSGVGKSTHTRKWCETFGDEAVLFNDDKPALRWVDGQWIAYGTPWSGKNGLNVNISAPIAGICFLTRGDRELRRLNTSESVRNILMQTLRRLSSEKMFKLVELIDLLVREIPIYQFSNHADDGDEMITYSTMSKEVNQ